MSALPVSTSSPRAALCLAPTALRHVHVTDYARAAAFDAAWSALEPVPAPPDSDRRCFAAHGAALGGAAQCDVTLIARERPVALIIGRRTRRRLRCRIGYLSWPTPALQCLDVVHGGLRHGNTEEGCRATVEELRRRLHGGDVDLVTINHLGLDDPLFTALADGRQPGAVTGSVDVEPHWSLALPGAAAEVTQRFSRKHRYNLRRAERQLARAAGALTLDVICDRANLPRLLRDGIMLTGRSYQRALRSGLRDDAAEHALLAAAADDSRLFGAVLRAGDRAIAFHCGLVIDGTFHLRSTAFDPEWQRYSPGQLLLVRVLETLVERNVHTVDYGFGDAEYKRTYGNRRREEATLRLYAPTHRGRLVHRIHTTALATHGALRSGVTRLGLDRVARNTWRAHLARATKDTTR